MPFRFEPPLSHESSRIFRRRDESSYSPFYTPSFPLVLALPLPLLSVFLEFRHLISRVARRSCLPSFMHLESRQTLLTLPPSFSLFFFLSFKRLWQISDAEAWNFEAGRGGNMYFGASSVDRLVIVSSFPPRAAAVASAV